MNRMLPIYLAAVAAPIIVSAGTAEAASARTVTGPAVNEPFGPIQVTITVSGRRIVSVSATGHPHFALSGQINRRAFPILDRETLAAQSAQGVHKVSGASYTSRAFATSLARAIANAGL